MKQKRTEVCRLGQKRVAGCNRYANAADEEAETMSKQKDGREKALDGDSGAETQMSRGRPDPGASPSLPP